jgi:hypothetical protein
VQREVEPEPESEYEVEESKQSQFEVINAVDGSAMRDDGAAAGAEDMGDLDDDGEDEDDGDGDVDENDEEDYDDDLLADEEVLEDDGGVAQKVERRVPGVVVPPITFPSSTSNQPQPLPSSPPPPPPPQQQPTIPTASMMSTTKPGLQPPRVQREHEADAAEPAPTVQMSGAAEIMSFEHDSPEDDDDADDAVAVVDNGDEEIRSDVEEGLEGVPTAAPSSNTASVAPTRASATKSVVQVIGSMQLGGAESSSEDEYSDDE